VVERHKLAQAVSAATSKERNAMKRNIPYWMQFGAVTAITAAVTATFLNIAAAFAADISSDTLKFGPGVVKAPGYETPATTYIVANPTSVYSDHSFYGTNVTGELKRGEHVDVLAKVKGWDWVLVGKDGAGIGYVSISMLSPADKYVP
jgi:hypothetical protein